MKFLDIFRRAVKEFQYVTRESWSYRDLGKFWDTVKEYDEIDEETYAYKRRFYDSIQLAKPFLKKNLSLLDIDCRTGNGTVFYHQKGLVRTAVCVTPSANFEKVCRQRLNKYEVNGKVLRLKELPLPPKSGSFNVILCLETIEHIPPGKRLGFLKELNRMLKDNGILILSMPNLLWEPVHWFAAIFGIHHSEGPHRFLSKKEIHSLFRECGFRIKRKKTTVLIPDGPRWLTKLGERLEEVFDKTLLPHLGLRRIYICKKA